MRLVVVGGSDAGIAAALRARALDPAGEVTVLVADAYPNYSICGLPYLLSGDVSDADRLAHRTRDQLEDTGMTLWLDDPATRIDPDARRVARDAGDLAYDALIMATGATPIRPGLPGLDLPGVHVLHTVQDALVLDEVLRRGRPRTTAIIGAGYIGLEMAEALTQRGLDGDTPRDPRRVALCHARHDRAQAGSDRRRERVRRRTPLRRLTRHAGREVRSGRSDALTTRSQSDESRASAELPRDGRGWFRTSDLSRV